MNNLSPFTVPPDMRALLQALKSEVLTEFNCHQVGVLKGYDPGTQTATVQLVLKRAIYNNPPHGSMIQPQPIIMDYPTLVQVPVFVYTGGGAYIVMPFAPGDPCLVLFNDRDLDPWFTFGTAPSLPNSNRLHSLADGMCLVGFRPATKLLSNVPSDGQHIAIGNSSGTLRAALDALCTALETAVISGSAFSAPTIAAIAAAKASIDAIIQ